MQDVIFTFILLQLIQQFILPVIVWSPVEQFPRIKFSCPKCTVQGCSLSPTTWTNGHIHHPRLIHDIHSNVLLFSRIYGCKNGHEVYGHHPQLVESDLIVSYSLPFLLWHSTGFTISSRTLSMFWNFAARV